MAIIGISRSDTFEYVSNDDPCKHWIDVPVDLNDASKGTEKKERIEEGATVFTLGVLDVFLMGYINDKNSTGVVNEEGQFNWTPRAFATNIDAVRFGLKGWKNFRDQDGNDLKFHTVRRTVNGRVYDAVDDACLNKLGHNLIQELGIKIKNESTLTRNEAKNSATA